MTFGLIESLLTLLLLWIGLYFYLTWTYDFWTSLGIVGPKPEIAFGNAKDLATRKKSRPAWLRDLYDEYRNEPMFGIYMRREPFLVLNDLELIKSVLIRDFNNFVDRGVDPDVHDALTSNLFFLKAEQWRPLRSKLSPVFTSGKLREMLYLMNECGDRLNKYLDEVDGQCIDIREISAKFTTDIIGLCAFGVDADALENEDSIFRQMGKKAFAIDWKRSLKMKLMEFAPSLYKIFGGWLTDRTVQNFFINLTRDTIKYREENKVVRHDFVDLLRALKDDPSKIDDIELTDSLMAAQLFIFFVAGFETSSSTMSNALLEMAMNHKIQDTLREEIRRELAETNGNITYEAIKRMKYLDKVIKETLRKYPPATILPRKASAAYTFSGTNITIPAGTKLLISVYGIQHDPRYYENPEIFNPENFNEEAVNSRPGMSFLPFGDGPRNCIGARFGSMQSKIGLVRTIQKYSVDVCEKTDKKYKLDPKAILLTPANGIVIKITKCKL